MIEVNNLNFKLDNFYLHIDSLKIKNGEKVAVLGENGSGKTTFFNIISGYYRTDKKVKINGKFIEDFEFENRSRIISYLPQFSDIIFNFTVFDVVLFGRYPFIKGLNFSQSDYKITENTLKLLSLENLKNKHFGKLSGGERKRVMLARVINQDSKILLLDEPFANLDIKNSVNLLKLLEKLNKTIICSIHDINIAVRGFSRLIFFKNGKIIYDIYKEELDEKKLFNVFEVKFKSSDNFFYFSE